MSFAVNLQDRIAKVNSRLCVGIDPDLTKIPVEIFDKSAEKGFGGPALAGRMLTEFSTRIIDAVAAHAACVKPNVAFFERYGTAGLASYYGVCSYAREQGLMVIADMKRGDIGSTAKAYAEGIFGPVSVPVKTGGFEDQELLAIDAVTLSPYLGADTLEPLIEYALKAEKGMFILCKTSNPGSGDLQDLTIEGEALYMRVAKMIQGLIDKHDPQDSQTFSSIGAVVGATYPEQLGEIRGVLKNSFFLIPGFGAQGGTAKDLDGAFYPCGNGAIINSSRGVIFAGLKDEYKGVDFFEAAADAALKAKEAINTAVPQA